jgi:RNA polymerase sigma factor (sigma-70 family)
MEVGCHMNARSLPLIGITEPNAAPTTASADLRAALERHHAESMGWALACCGFDRSEASDVLQDAYLKVLDGRAVFRGESSFRTWLFGVVRRTASEHRRNVFRRLSAMWRVLSDDVVADTPDPDDAMDGRAVADRLRAALKVLPARQRQVLYLVFHEELTVDAAAGVMGISVGSARTHYARGKARLREFLHGRRP